VAVEFESLVPEESLWKW